jgi:MYXO-CTERM domain-containing protein
MDLAFAARDVDVASLVKGSLPDGVTLSRGTLAGPPRIPPTGGCAGCSAAPGAEDYATAGLFALGFLVMTRKRRE